MATSPDVVRRGLQTVTGAAQRDLRAVTQQAPQDASRLRATLFAATPLIVNDYIEGTAALALDWFDELRFEAGVRTPFAPRPVITVTDEEIAASTAKMTEALWEIEQGIADDLQRATDEALAALEAQVQRDVARGFWDSMTVNTDEDPEAVGWRRYASPGACKFCVMLAAKGAVFDEESVRFAAHGNCSCTVGPSWDPDAERADVMQRFAQSNPRTPEQRAKLRDYLNENYPDAPG